MRRTRLLIILLVVFGVVGYWCDQQVPWIDLAASIHSQRGSIDCGHVLEPDAKAAQVSIDCALSARASGRPFMVVFSVHGIDERISNAVVVDSKGSGTEVFYAVGMLNGANTLLKHRCDAPVKLQVDTPTTYRIPRLHCAPWPTTDLVRDRLMW